MGLLEKSNPFIYQNGFWSGKARYRVLYGGRASSKSHEFATVLAHLVAYKPLKVLCTRAFQNKIKDSVKALIEEKISLLQLDKLYEVQERSIKSIAGGEFLFYGLARNTGEIKSLEGVDICYIEEGQYITKEMWDILIPTIRKEGSEVWVSFNPLLETDFIYKLTLSLDGKKNARVLKVNYPQNPFLSDTMLSEIESKRDDRDFNHIYLGEPRRELENAVIRWGDVKNAITQCDRHIMGGIVGVDIADGGDDLNAISVILKNKCVYLEEFRSERGDFNATIERVIRVYNRYRCDTIIFDSVGVGASFGVLIRQRISKGTVREFIAGARPINKGQLKRTIGDKDKFKNIKAQMWVYLSYLLEQGQFKICSMGDTTDKLMRELTAPQLIEQEGRKIGIEPKEKMKERGIPSPNLADSLIMGLYGDIGVSW